jgi:hypothetical protein
VNMVMNLRVPLNVVKFLSGCTSGGFSAMGSAPWSPLLGRLQRTGIKDTERDYGVSTLL